MLGAGQRDGGASPVSRVDVPDHSPAREIEALIIAALRAVIAAAGPCTALRVADLAPISPLILLWARRRKQIHAHVQDLCSSPRGLRVLGWTPSRFASFLPEGIGKCIDIEF